MYASSPWSPLPPLVFLIATDTSHTSTCRNGTPPKPTKLDGNEKALPHHPYITYANYAHHRYSTCTFVYSDQLNECITSYTHMALITAHSQLLHTRQLSLIININ